MRSILISVRSSLGGLSSDNAHYRTGLAIRDLKFGIPAIEQNPHRLQSRISNLESA